VNPVQVIGLISPGEMGASIGAAARASASANGSDAKVIWAGDGRSESSHQRANRAGIIDCESLETMVTESTVILSVCPPHNAESVAQSVMQFSFSGLFVDCNAIAPQKSRHLESLIGSGHFVDAGIIGGPAWNHEVGTCLYLSGERSAQISELFTDSPLLTKIISDEIGAASAMKMVFAAYTKGSTALLAAILGVAEREGVRDALENQWGQIFTTQTHHRLISNSSKAWRFSGEMREIAATFDNAGLPVGFHSAAAEVFEHLKKFKDAPATDIADFLNELTNSKD
jgi:3-hydroxyisobutyrate dehydrogenase-like beta-hydroxyacid dehydrogenase